MNCKCCMWLQHLKVAGLSEWSIKPQDLSQRITVLNFNIRHSSTKSVWQWNYDVYHCSTECLAVMIESPTNLLLSVWIFKYNKPRKKSTVSMGMLLVYCLTHQKQLGWRTCKQACLPWIHSSGAYLSHEVGLCIKATLFLQPGQRGHVQSGGGHDTAFKFTSWIINSLTDQLWMTPVSPAYILQSDTINFPFQLHILAVWTKSQVYSSNTWCSDVVKKTISVKSFLFSHCELAHVSVVWKKGVFRMIWHKMSALFGKPELV